MAARLVATDLDGTLLSPGAVVSDRTRRAVRAASEAGVHVVAATGRGIRSAAALLAELPEIRHAVLSNGAQVRALPGHVLAQHLVEPDAVDATLDVLGRIAPERGLAWEHDGGFSCDARYRELAPEDLLDLPYEPGERPGPGTAVLKLLVRHPTIGEAALLDRLRRVLPPLVTPSSSGGGNLVEITGRGVTKALGLEVLCAHLGVDRGDVVAVGDNVNDVAMLRWAGRGVAVANAAAEAAAAADERVASNADDGVAVLLESLC